MKKNGFLTFIFACIPGAGQMYYGYMQRGLSLVTICGLCFMAATVFDPIIFMALVVWMYSFFDTYDLIRHMAAGDPKEDGLLLIGNAGDLKKLVPQHSKLVGWGLIGVGAWALYDLVIGNWLVDFLDYVLHYNGYAYQIIHGIPNLIIACALIYVGIRLLGLHPAKKENHDDDLPPYPHE